MKIKQLNTQQICRAHRSSPGRVFGDDEILPDKICPLLYHSVYPYCLGAIYGSKYDYNAEGDVHVCCPAAVGVDCLVRVRPNDGTFGDEVGDNVKTVCFAEVVKAVACPHGHVVGQKFVFPNCMKDHYLCPAGLNNIFPFLNITLPPCIDIHNLRCPDWKDTIYYSIEDGSTG